MQLGLNITIVDTDDDYLGIEICAANGRFSGATYIYAGLDELSEFAGLLAGFPQSRHDERCYEFGSAGAGTAGGYARLRAVERAQAGEALLPRV